MTGCLVLIGIFVILPIFVGALIGGGGESAGGSGGGGREPAEENEPVAAQAGGNEPEPEPEPAPPPEPRYQVGETATVGNVEWTVNDAFLTEQLRSNFGTQKRGDFVVVDFTFTNNRNEEVTLDPELHMILEDSEGREFGSDFDAWEFVPTDLNIFLEPVNPGLSTDGRVIYEVAPDASGFKLTLDDVEFLEDQSAVYNLSNISAEAYDPASASASASPAAGQ